MKVNFTFLGNPGNRVAPVSRGGEVWLMRCFSHPRDAGAAPESVFGQFLLSIGLALLLAGCDGKPKTAGPPPKMEAQVVVAEARRQLVAEKISLVGSLLANESLDIKSEIDGKVTEIKFLEGAQVQPGDPLVLLDESKLAPAVAAAEADFKLSEVTLARTKQLYEGKLVAQQEFDLAAATRQAREAELVLRRQQLKDARIVAPLAGVMGERYVSAGQVIARNTLLARLTDFSLVKIEVRVPERFAGALQVGQVMAIKVAAHPGKIFPGEVYFISPQMDPATRTILVKGKAPNPDGQLQPGMLANLDLTVAVRENAVVIPERALSRVMNDNRAMLFVVDEKNTAQMKPVKLGIRLAGEVEIVEGLGGGERVVVEGMQKIGPGSAVKVAEGQGKESGRVGK